MKLIAERETTHGDFPTKARFIQAFKLMMRAADGYDELTPAQRESLDMIATKIGRILFGNANTRDHWVDIAGYAELVAKELADAPMERAASPESAHFPNSFRDGVNG